MAVSLVTDSNDLLYNSDTGPGLRQEVSAKRLLAPAAVPVIDTTPYAVGQYMAPAFGFNVATRLATGGGKILSVRVFDKANQSAAMTVLFFMNNVSTVFAAHGVASIVAADIPKIAGHIEIVNTDYRTINGQSIATKQVTGLPFQTAVGQQLLMVLVAQATPTYTSAADLAFVVGIETD